MRAAYDDLLEVGLPLHVVRQGGDDDPDAIAESESVELRAACNDSSLEPTEVASLVEQFREENELLDRLTDAGTVDIEAEHTTGDSAPGVTLEHIARSIENGRRVILLAWPDTAESIARRLDEYPECMRTFSGEGGVHRLYNANGDVQAGSNEIRVYRPAEGQNKWLYHEATGEVELRANGETIATFADPENAFTDPTAYPATEKDITDFSEWTTIKRPALPSRIDRSMVDVIAVTDDGLEVLEPSGGRTPIASCSRKATMRRPARFRSTTSDAASFSFRPALCNAGLCENDDCYPRFETLLGQDLFSPNDVTVYRPAGGQIVWRYHEESESVELCDSNGDTLATFDDPEDVFADPTAYPATEAAISTFDKCTAIKRPALPGRIDREMVDVIAVVEDGLRVLNDGDEISLGKLLEKLDRRDVCDQDDGSSLSDFHT